MANAVYPAFKQALGAEGHNMTVDAIWFHLIDLADYTYNSAHDFLDDVAAAAREESFGPVLSPTFTGGVFDCADFVFVNAAGDQCEALICENHNGNGAAADTARQLIAFWDTGITGMPVSPNGGNINVTVHNSGWFAL